MPKPIATFCRIGNTNYVTYKGERLTVRQYNKKYGVKVKVPKDVKVCEPLCNHDDYKYLGCEVCFPDFEMPLYRTTDAKLRKWESWEEIEGKRVNWWYWLALLIGTLLVLAY